MAERRVTFIIGANYENFKKGLKTAQKELRSFSRKAERVGRSFTTGLTLPILGAGAAAVNQAAKMEQLQTQLEILTGSAEKGARAFERLKKFSAETPFQIQDITKANNTLLGFGLSADEAFESLQNIGDIAAVTGGDIQSIAVAFGQSSAEGKLFSKDIRQFINQGVPAVELLSESMGVAKDQVFDLASQGKISFADLQKSFRDATKEGGKFEDGMKKQSETIAGQFSTLKDNINLFAAEVGEVIIEAIAPFTSKIREMVKAGKEVNPEFIRMGVVVGMLAAAIGPTILVISKLAAVLAAIATPLAIKIAALMAAAGAVWYLYENSDAALGLLESVYSTAIANILAHISQYMRAVQKLADLTGNKQLALGLTGVIGAVNQAMGDLSTEKPRKEFQTFSEFLETVKGRLGSVMSGITGYFFDMDMFLDSGSEKGQVLAQTFMGGVIPTLNIAGMTAEQTAVRLKTMGDGMDEASNAALFLDDVTMQFTSSFGDGMANVVVQGQRVVDVLNNIGKLLLSAAIQKGISLLLGSASGGTGLLGSVFGGFFASGGKLQPGQWGIVGEKGPEPIFATNTGAVITPNSSMSSTISSGGGRGSQQAVVNVYIDSRLVDRQLTELRRRRS